MSFDLQKILESKRAFRRDLAARPIADKLRMLDVLRERELAIRNRATQSESAFCVNSRRPLAPSAIKSECQGHSPEGEEEVSPGGPPPHTRHMMRLAV